MYTSAFPAVNHADWNKSAAIVRNLDKLRERIKTLEAAVAAGTEADNTPDNIPGSTSGKH